MADLLAIAGGIGTGLGQVGKDVSALGEMVEKRRMREEEMGLKQALNRRAEEELGLKKAQDVRAADLAKEVREAVQRTNRIAAVEEKEKTRRERPIDVQQYMGQLGVPEEAQQTLLKWAEAEGAIESLEGMPDIKTSSLKYIVPFMEKLQKDPARLYQLSMISLSSMRKKLQELQAKGEKLKPEEQATMQTLSTQYMGELAHAKALEAQLKMDPEKPYYPIGAGGAIGSKGELIPPQARVGEIPKKPKGFETMEEAISEAKRVLEQTPPDSGLVATAELGAQNLWVPKLVPNITLRIPSNIPTATPGIAYNKRDKTWERTDAQGRVSIISSDEAMRRNLEYKEQIPTADIRVMQQSVPSVMQLIRQSREALKSTEKRLGPLSSRWRELWSGKLGASDPDFRRVRSDLNLLVTRLMKMHVGARGGQYIMQHFEELINASKDHPDNLKAALNEIEQYAQEVGLPISEQKAGMKATEELDLDAMKRVLEDRRKRGK